MKNSLVSVYIDINPITGNPFYVGIGNKLRIGKLKRNKLHTKLVETFPNKKFTRNVIHKDIPLLEAWEIEKSLIKLYGKMSNGSGILTNIHDGGPLEFNFRTSAHWMKGKRFKDAIPYYENTRKGKTYKELFGEERAIEIINRQRKNAIKSFKDRIQISGKTQKEIERSKNNTERLNRKQFTLKELNSFKNASERQKGVSLKEKIDNSLKSITGKTYKELYGMEYVHPHKGKTKKQILGNDYVSPLKGRKLSEIRKNDYIIFNKGKTYESLYGIERSNEIKRKQAKKGESRKKRVMESGFTEKELKWFTRNKERRQNKHFTENEVNHFKNLSILKKGKTFKELYGENYIHPSKGKSYAEIHGADYIHPCLGKTMKELRGQDYIDPRANSFYVQINDASPILFASERDMMKYFKCSKSLLHKIKKEVFIVNENNSPKCNQPSGTILKYISKYFHMKILFLLLFLGFSSCSTMSYRTPTESKIERNEDKLRVNAGKLIEVAKIKLKDFSTNKEIMNIITNLEDAQSALDVKVSDLRGVSELSGPSLEEFVNNLNKNGAKLLEESSKLEDSIEEENNQNSLNAIKEQAVREDHARTRRKWYAILAVLVTALGACVYFFPASSLGVVKGIFFK
jgi:hypothetical protein